MLTKNIKFNNFLINFPSLRSHKWKYSINYVQDAKIPSYFSGPKGKKGKCCQGYPIRHYGVQLGVGIASGEGQLIGLAANRRRS